MRFQRTLLLAGALLCMPAWSSPDTVEAPILKQGDRWTYQAVDGFTGLADGGTEVRVVEVRPDGYLLERSLTPGVAQTTDVTLELNARQTIDGVAGDAGELKFPLVLGRKWKSLALVENPSTRTTSLLDLEREVVAFEKVKVPAGEFNAYKIVAKGRWTLRLDPMQVGIPGLSGRYEMTVWYAPAAKRIVASETDSYTGGRLARRNRLYLSGFELH